MKNIQRLRLKAGLSQSQLEQLCGITHTSLIKYESGQRDINKACGITLYIISKALDCTIEDLLETKKD